MKIAIVDSSDCEYAQPQYLAKCLRKLGNEVSLFKDSYCAPKGFITICIGNNIGPDFTDNHPAIIRARKSKAQFKFIGDKSCYLKYFSDNPNYFYLPYGVDMDVYHPFDLPKKIDVSFVGYNRFNKRKERLNLLKREFGKRFVYRQGVFFENCARIYSQSKIVFNDCAKGEVNMRTFEILACNTLLVINKVAYLDELFKDGVHLVTYQSNSELIEKIKYYLKNESEREKIAQNGYEEVKKHTYLERAKFIDMAVKKKYAHMESKEAYKEFYEKQAKSITTHQERLLNWAIPDPKIKRFRIRERYKEIAKRCRGTILNIGCQVGGYERNLIDKGFKDITGIDISENYVKMAQKNVPEAKFMVADAEELPFNDDSFDTVILGEILEHVRNLKKVTDEAQRVCKRGGIILGSTPQYETVGEEHVRIVTKDDLVSLFGRSVKFIDIFGYGNDLVFYLDPYQ